MKVRDLIIHTFAWLAFWVIVTFWQLEIFSLKPALTNAFIIAIISITVFYANYGVLLPKLFSKGKTLYYIFSLIGMLLGMYLIFDITLQWLPRPEDMPFPGPKEFEEIMKMRPGMKPRENFRNHMIPITAAHTIPMLFLSSLLWFDNENRIRREKEVSLTNENLVSEMRFLKSQINPHFLFNALNNIYSLSFRKSDHTPEMIMKLSEMLRHVVYDSTISVSLQKEIGYIQNYIDFQSLKLGSDKGISFRHEGVNNLLIIEPMLLIPFIENAFKHSDIEDTDDAFITINLSTEGSIVRLEVQNSFSYIPQTRDQTPGIGWQNVQQRLNLVYPKRSKLTKKIAARTFIVNLEIDTHA